MLIHVLATSLNNLGQGCLCTLQMLFLFIAIFPKNQTKQTSKRFFNFTMYVCMINSKRGASLNV